MDTAIDTIAQSPVPNSSYDPMRGKALVDFYTALKAVAGGKKITRLDWGNADDYGFLMGEMLHIHRKLENNPHVNHRWNVVLGDMIADDWIILD